MDRVTGGMTAEGLTEAEADVLSEAMAEAVTASPNPRAGFSPTPVWLAVERIIAGRTTALRIQLEREIDNRGDVASELYDARADREALRADIEALAEEPHDVWEDMEVIPADDLRAVLARHAAEPGARG